MNLRDVPRLTTLAVPLAIFAASCGGGGSNAPASPTASTSPNSSTGGAGTTSSTGFAAAYKTARWESAVSVSFPSSCTMTLTTTGVPPFHNDYYLAPVSSQYPDSVAVTPVSKTEMSLVPYTSANISGASATINVCPTKAATTTVTNMGTIGYMISGEALFNPYEANGQRTPALSDNVSYTFTTSTGKTETASFIDACNSHPTPVMSGYDWHHHGVPTCLAAQIDGSGGPSHLIGVALDGFPIYGGRDINGKTIAVAQLDACNGITSPTPEFPQGAYHYVLPIGVTGSRSSLNCYAGTVSQQQLAAATRYLCGTDALNARLQAAARVRRLRTALNAALDKRRTVSS